MKEKLRRAINKLITDYPEKDLMAHLELITQEYPNMATVSNKVLLDCIENYLIVLESEDMFRTDDYDDEFYAE